MEQKYGVCVFYSDGTFENTENVALGNFEENDALYQKLIADWGLANEDIERNCPGVDTNKCVTKVALMCDGQPVAAYSFPDAVRHNGYAIEYIPHRKDYRVFNPLKPDQTIAYSDAVEEVRKSLDEQSPDIRNEYRAFLEGRLLAQHLRMEFDRKSRQNGYISDTSRVISDTLSCASTIGFGDAYRRCLDMITTESKPFLGYTVDFNGAFSELCDYWPRVNFTSCDAYGLERDVNNLIDELAFLQYHSRGGETIKSSTEFVHVSNIALAAEKPVRVDLNKEPIILDGFRGIYQ